jgi:hypothetical protein
LSQRRRKKPKSKSLKFPGPISQAMDEKKGQLFIDKAPEDIKMKETEKTETEDARSGKKGNR